ncbi:MAG: NAD(P)H-binding protein [Marinilabiliaceae bacterium]|nr:NAD(P)H-binding protein [Marinilabiliaceae bacterium]
MMVNKTAIVFGATGLIGTYLVEELIQNMGYTAIKSFTRRKLDIEHIKLIEHVVDVEDVASYADKLRGDDLFICLGTTRKKAGSIKRYEELDRDMPVNIAEAALSRGVKKVAVVSSLGANENSGSYYSRIKGEMEKGIEKLPFEKVLIARPSLLLGERKESRPMEKAAIVFYKIFSFLLIGKLKFYRAIHGRDVARAMIELLVRNDEKTVFLSHELQEIADMKRKDLNDRT